MEDDYSAALQILRLGDAEQLDRLRLSIPGFPHGVDDFVGRAWITNAIDVGSSSTIRWLLAQGVDLDFRDDEGYTPLLSALERTDPNKHLILDLLLNAGAPVNRKGINDYAPAHLAAARNDVAALRLLVRHGADLSLRTDIDHFATPLETARFLGHEGAATYLAEVGG